MDQPQETDHRLIDLETKVAYLERAMGELDGVVRTLSDELDATRKEVAYLRAVEAARREPPSTERPPHY